MKNSKKHTYSSIYSDELLLKCKALLEEKGKQELSMPEVEEALNGMAEFVNLLQQWELKEEDKSKLETQNLSEPVLPKTKSKKNPDDNQPKPTAKTPATNPVIQESKPDKTYTLPISNITINHKKLFGDSDKVFLRPAELKNYGLPTATVNDMVYRASEMEDPFPFIKLGRKTLIPRVALEEWILRQAHVREK